MRRNSGAKHCSSLCSQSEGGEDCGGPARAENPTKSCSRALVMFATCSWPSLCEQSELQCWRRNRRLCEPVLISAARALPLTFNISFLNTLRLRVPMPQIASENTILHVCTPHPTSIEKSCRNAIQVIYSRPPFVLLAAEGSTNRGRELHELRPRVDDILKNLR